MPEILKARAGTYARRTPWWGLLPIGASYLRGGQFWHAFAAGGVVLFLLLWTGFFPRRLILDEDGLTLKRLLFRTRRVRWDDVDHFEAYARGGPSYSGWYERNRTGVWWKRSAPDGGILPVFPRPGTTQVMKLEELTSFLNDKVMRRPGWSPSEPQPFAADDARFAQGLAEMIVNRADGASVDDAEQILDDWQTRGILIKGGIDPEDVRRRLHAQAASESARPSDDGDPFRSGRL